MCPNAQEAEAGRKCREIVAAEGWQGFRAREEAVLRQALAAHGTATVLSCGGGVVESPGAREALHEPV